MTRTLLIILVLCIGVASAQTAPPKQPDKPAGTDVAANAAASTKAPLFAERNPRYQLRSGDVLSVEFTFSPEMNQDVAVQPDGFITLKEIGDIHVEGMTLPQFNETLKHAYANILHDPVINIALKEFEKPHFIVNGEVGHPGKFELRASTSVAEAIGIAGGFTPAAKHSQVLLFRRVSDQWYEVKKLDVKHMLASADLKEDVFLRPGDMLYVPKNRISKIRQFLPSNTVGVMANPANF